MAWEHSSLLCQGLMQAMWVPHLFVAHSTAAGS